MYNYNQSPVNTIIDGKEKCMVKMPIRIRKCGDTNIIETCLTGSRKAIWNLPKQCIKRDENGALYAYINLYDLEEQVNEKGRTYLRYSPLDISKPEQN